MIQYKKTNLTPDGTSRSKVGEIGGCLVHIENNSSFEITVNGKRHKERTRRGVVVIATAQLHSTKLELRFCAGSNPARGVSEIRDGKDL